MALRDLISPFYAWKRALEKPITVKKPLTEREGAEHYRGFHINDVEQCIGCGSCESICQNAAIDMVPTDQSAEKKGDSGLRPLVDYGRCCWCALCVDVCPTGSLGMSNEYTWIESDAEAFRYIPGIDKKEWDSCEKGYRRTEEAWIVTPQREAMNHMEPEERATHFEEFTLGFDPDKAILEAERCLDCGLCVQACPTHMDIPHYIRMIRDRKLEEGLKILYKTNPFSESCGRVCTAHCEDVCAVGVLGEPIAIRWLKRHITDSTVAKRAEILDLKPVPENGKHVAVIGGGPGGLTAAFYLRRFGFAVTLYESHDKLGGMLKYGIPDYRLPEYALGNEIQFILDQGVDVHLNTVIGKDISLEEIDSRFDAVLIAIGAQKGSLMPIEGLDNEGVLSGVDFLERIAAGERPDLGEKVAVVGGGNTAMDCCRSSRRLGSEVQCVYRRTEKEMPANPEEIEEAKEEAVEFHFLTTPTVIERKDGKLHLTCLEMELGEPDESGRRRPVPKPGSEFTMIVDTLLMAIGQKIDAAFCGDFGLELTRWGSLVTDGETQSMKKEKYFSAGDCETGPDDAIKAVAAGKNAAYHIQEFLFPRED